MRTRKIGRDAITGRFVPVDETRRRPTTTTVETMRIKRKGGWRRER